MTAFKVGDRVRMTKTWCGKLAENPGTVGFVGDGYLGVDFDAPFDGHGPSGRKWNVPPEKLELATAAPQQPFPVGSYVRHLTSQPNDLFRRGDVTKVESYDRFDGWLEFKDRDGDILSRPASDFEAADEPRIEAAPPAAPPRRIEIGDTFKALCDGLDYDKGDTFVVTGIDSDDHLNFTDNNGDENFIDRGDAEFVSSHRPFKAGDWVNTPGGRGLVVHDDGDPEGDEPYHVILAIDPDYFNAADLTLTTPYGETEPAAAEPEPANDNIRPGDIVQVTDRSSFSTVVRVGDLATVTKYDGHEYTLSFPRPRLAPLTQWATGGDIAPYPARIAA